MSSLKDKLPPIWRDDLSDKLAWQIFWALLVDWIIAFSGPGTPDGFGVVWSVYTAPDFLATFGSNPIILVDPGQAAGDAVQLAQWAADKTAYLLCVEWSWLGLLEKISIDS